jgi:hypothetical protein
LALTLSTSDDCTAVGAFSLAANSTGADNTAVGAYALEGNTTGGSNVAVGMDTLKANTTGVRNIAVGSEAYNASDTENDNVAIGHAAMTTNTAGGTRNVAVGNYALDALTSADDNVAVGHTAGTSITTAGNCTFVGRDAGGQVTTGESNTAIGYATLVDTAATDGGRWNTAVGAFSRVVADGEGAVVIGYNVSGTEGYTTLGKDADDIRAAHGNTSWATVSDERVKKDITDSTAGLSVINDLRPRTFKYKNKGDIPEAFDAYEEGSTETYKNTFTNHGFIAQEVKEVVDNHSELKDGFKMWDIREHSGQQEVGETAIIPVLVKAVQELSAQNADLLARIETLEG